MTHGGYKFVPKPVHLLLISSIYEGGAEALQLGLGKSPKGPPPLGGHSSRCPHHHPSLQHSLCLLTGFPAEKVQRRSLTPWLGSSPLSADNAASCWKMALLPPYTCHTHASRPQKVNQGGKHYQQPLPCLKIQRKIICYEEEISPRRKK